MEVVFWIFGYHAQFQKEDILLFLLVIFAGLLISIAWKKLTTWSRRRGKAKLHDFSEFAGIKVEEQFKIQNYLAEVPKEYPFVELRNSLDEEKKRFDADIAELMKALKLLEVREVSIDTNRSEALYRFINWLRFGNICQKKNAEFRNKISISYTRNINIIKQIRGVSVEVQKQVHDLRKDYQAAVLKFENIRAQGLSGENLEKVGVQLNCIKNEIKDEQFDFQIDLNTTSIRIPWMQVVAAAHICKKNRLDCNLILKQLELWIENLEESQLNLNNIDKQLIDSKNYLQKAMLLSVIKWSEQVEILVGLVKERKIFNGFPGGFNVDVLVVVNDDTKKLKEKIVKFVPAIQKIESNYAELAPLIKEISQALTKINSLFENLKKESILGINWESKEVELENVNRQYMMIAEKSAYLPNELLRDLEIARELNIKVRSLEEYSSDIEADRNYIIQVHQRVLHGKNPLPSQTVLADLQFRISEYDILNWGKYQEFVRTMLDQLATLEVCQKNIQIIVLETKIQPKQILAYKSNFQIYDQKYSEFCVNKEKVESILGNVVDYEKKSVELLERYTRQVNNTNRLVGNDVFRQLVGFKFVQYIHSFEDMRFDINDRKNGLVEKKYQKIFHWTSEFNFNIDEQYLKVKAYYSEQLEEIEKILSEIKNAANVNKDREIDRAKSYLSEGDSLIRASGYTVNEKVNLIENFCIHYDQGIVIADGLGSKSERVRAAKNDVESAFSQVETVRTKAQKVYGKKWHPVRQNIEGLEKKICALKDEWKNIQTNGDTLENKIHEYSQLEKRLSSGSGLWGRYDNAIREAQRDRQILDDMERGLNNIVEKLNEWLSTNYNRSYEERLNVMKRITRIESTLKEIRARYENDSFSPQNYQKVYDAYRDLIDSVKTNIIINNNNQILITGDIYSGGDVIIKQKQIIMNNNNLL